MASLRPMNLPRSVFIADGFMDPAGCRRVRRAMTDGTHSTGKVLDGSIVERLDVRRVLDVDVTPDILSCVEARLDECRSALAEFFGVSLARREGAGFLRYERGGFYAPHRDRGITPAWPQAELRQVALVVFLNSGRHGGPDGDFDGGTLRLYLDGESPLDIHPCAGRLVAFPADVLHEVTPVLAGTRDTIVDWFYADDGTGAANVQGPGSPP